MASASGSTIKPLLDKYTHKNFPGVLSKNDVMIRITTIQEFLDWTDLRAVYLDEKREMGAPGFFIAIPKIAGTHSISFGTKLEDKDKVDAIGYYFKSGTRQTLNRDYNNNAVAGLGVTGGAYTCFKDDKANKAELDILSFNSKAYSKAKTPLEKLNALAIGLRFTPLGDGTGDIQVACDSGNVVDVYSPYPGDPVQTFAIFRNYKDGDEDKRKADGFDVYGPRFGGHFIWEKSKGVMSNAEELIEIYEDLGYEYED